MGVKFFNNLELEQANHVQFKTAAGANAGKIEQSGDDLLLTNATGDILLGSGSADVNIGDGTNTVDIRFEQSMAIFADSSSTRTLTLGGLNTNVVVESPTLNTPTIASAATVDTTLTFTGANSFIMFDYEPPNDSGMYTNPVPLLKIDRNGNPQTILQRESEMGALTLGIDDTVAICAGDTRTNVRANTNFVAEQVILAAEGGFFAFGFPNNDTTWSNRNTFRFRSESTTASDNGLYLGDSSNGTKFIDINRNLSVVSVTSTGHIKAQAGGNVFVYDDDDDTKIHGALESNATEGVLKVSNGSNFGLIARGVTNNPRIGAFHNGTLRIYGFTNSNGSDGASDHNLATFDFANDRFDINGGLRAFGGTVILSNLPTSDPSNAGQLWNDSGTLKISAG
tara:strand:+ start:1924 stop:3111 length:1188 start_codon:yes stop_codon:yes gene_type:complete